MRVFAGPKFYRTAVWIFAGFALLLAVIGIYGIVSYAVVQRTQEMGVRMALGTTPVRLRGMLLRQGLLMVMAGAIPGIAGARLTGRFLESLMDGAKPIGLATSCRLGLAVRAGSVGEHLVRHAPHRQSRYQCHPAQRVALNVWDIRVASLRSADSRDGCLYMSGGAAGRQQIPRPLSARSE